MKNVYKLLGIIALVAVIGFSFAACNTGGGGGGGGGGVNTSLDGKWKDSDNWQISISGSSATITKLGDDASALWKDGISKGYIKVGIERFRNLTKTGDLTWTGEVLAVTYTGSNTVATGTGWNNMTITMNADGKSFRLVDEFGETQDWTRM